MISGLIPCVQGAFDAQPVPLPDGRRHHLRRGLWRDFRAGELRLAKIAGNDGVDPAGQVCKEIAPRIRGMRSKASDEKLTGLFLDMLAAEQGAGENTLGAYRRDLEDFSTFLSQQKQAFATVQTEALRGYLADLDVRGFKSSSIAR